MDKDIFGVFLFLLLVQDVRLVLDLDFPVDMDLLNNDKCYPPTAAFRRTPETRQTLTILGCRIVTSEICPEPNIRYYLYSQAHPEEPEGVRIGADPNVSNLTRTAFDPALPTKIIIHGYNSNITLGALVEIRKQYLMKANHNVFFVDWAYWAEGPCYPGAVWNINHVGECTALLVQRIRELGAKDIHMIGFSLGAQVQNYVAKYLLPYKLPRITGLDPAGPLFFTASADQKLDKTDAEFVDVIHTNAFVQGTFQESGHVDFYVNGGVFQPGCWAENRSLKQIPGYIACNHHRAPIYFAESITTKKGFWGWPCPSYGSYIFGSCPPVEPQILMGEEVKRSASGMYLVITNSISPYADGKFTGPNIEIMVQKSEVTRMAMINKYMGEIKHFYDEDDLADTLQKYRRDHGVYPDDLDLAI